MSPQGHYEIYISSLKKMKSLTGTITLILFSIFVLQSCNNAQQNSRADSTDTTTSAMDPEKDWKLGIALWTFHTVSFPQSLDQVDSCGVQYIEPNTFHRAGAELKDSIISQLSPDGIQKLKSLIEKKGLKCESLYVVGDSTMKSWIQQFTIAKEFGVKYVTTEPPLNMWDKVDSLAGAYGLKVAIHEHWPGFSHYWNPDTVLLAIKGHPNFGACADLGHWPKSGINPVDAVKKLAGHIFTIHLKDIAAYNNINLKDVPVGTGVVDFPAVFQELKDQHFNGNIFIERDAEDQPSNVPSVIQTVKYYHDQLQKLK